MVVGNYLLWKPEHGVFFVHWHGFVDSYWFWKLFLMIGGYSEIGFGKNISSPRLTLVLAIGEGKKLSGSFSMMENPMIFGLKKKG
jgi:hypothetical protein